jgi:hypothetical protein
MPFAIVVQLAGSVLGLGLASRSAQWVGSATMSKDEEKTTEREPVGWGEPDPQASWTRDQRLIVIGIAVAVIIGAVGIIVSADSGTRGQAKRVASRPTSSATTPSTASQPPTSPTLSPNATCANVREAAAIGAPRARRVFIDSPGQIGGGPNTMKGRLLTNNQWTAWLHVRTGEEVELSVRLHDPDYGSVEEVSVATQIVEHADGCWRLSGAVRYATDYGRPTMLGPLLIQLQPSQHATRLAYVPHTTRLIDEHDKELTKLPDGVLGVGTTLPYSVPPGAINVYFVNFRLKLS